MSASTFAVNHKTVGMIAGIGILCLGYTAAQSSVKQPNVARGAVIAAKGVAGGATACAQCHAYNGSADGSGAFPRLAGQSAFYLAKELRDYVMADVAKGLDTHDIAAVAAYFQQVDASARVATQPTR
jgi:cytochrome c553